MGNVPEKCDNPTGTVQQDLCDRPVAAGEDASHSHGGFEDERFKDTISDNFHCAICTNVFKDPVMCSQNEHIFCRLCITKCLASSERCPTCMEPLTVETLRVPPRIVFSCLSEFKIPCDFHDRGCQQLVRQEKLEQHVMVCGFAPAICSNEGCQVEVNARDLIHHENTACKKRRVQCHNCAELKQEMTAVKEKLSTATKKLDKVETDMKGIKESLSVVVEHVKGRSKGATSYQMSTLLSKSQKFSVAGRAFKTNIVVAGGSRSTYWRTQRCLNSVEMFDTVKETWTVLQPMRECRKNASSVLYNNQIIVSGGWCGNSGTQSMEALPNADQVTQSVTWNKFPAVLSDQTHGHRSVVYKDQLIIVGGHDAYDITKRIYDVSFTPPYNLKQLTRMRHKRMSPGVHLFDDKLVVVGGETYYEALNSVLMYDVVRNESKELAPLPYSVSEMASVSWGDNILIVGGAAHWAKLPTCQALEVLDSVVLYNVRTQNIRMMQRMKYKRRGATAVIIGESVYVMGGTDENAKELKSVECFNVERNSWRKLPSMNEERYQATSVAC